MINKSNEEPVLPKTNSIKLGKKTLKPSQPSQLAKTGSKMRSQFNKKNSVKLGKKNTNSESIKSTSQDW